MHPKPLLDLCIDFLVNSTRAYQQQCHSYEAIWKDVGELWADLWYLPPRVPDRATHLLHTHLIHDCLEAKNHGVHDVTRSLLIMLAVKTHKIAFVQVDRQLAILNSSAFFSVDVFIGENLLQELDVTGIDLMEDMSVLLALLPLCPKLTIVKLGGNTTPEVLRAAMNCPITILHISERLAWEPRVTEAVLMDIMIGAGNQSSIRLLESVREGKPITGGLSWPQLSDFSTGYCHVQVNFLLLILVVFTKLQCLASNLVSLHTVLHAFNNLRKEISSIHTLSLKTSTMQSGEGFIDILSCVAPELEELKILAIKNCANITN
ncbi:uncharacterized protein [Procambarus clarkii]|uniref:uncharacterized protein n=1 Tax=Procambarus clarkii TaxID=6728 RepID=UPI001E67432B|nr:uncharacterized protein LOC123764535 [Procambarus clarkii]